MEGRAAATRSPASEAKDNHYEGNGGERHHSFVGTAEYVSPEVGAEWSPDDAKPGGQGGEAGTLLRLWHISRCWYGASPA